MEFTLVTTPHSLKAKKPDYHLWLVIDQGNQRKARWIKRPLRTATASRASSNLT